MRLALVSCVRDEAELLPAFLAYHRALGVTRFYLYLDHSSDASEDVARSCADAVALRRDRTAAHLTLHQIACADDALARARAEGFDWLLHLDVDEFAFGGNAGEGALARGDLRTLLSTTRPETEAVVLRTCEAVPTVAGDGAPFWTLRDFLVDAALERPVLDPTTQRLRRLDRWLGHDLGKSIVRVAADVQAATSHAWTRRQGVALPEPRPIPTERRGRHYHFVVQGARHWREKYRKLASDPPHWPRGGRVPFPKQAWKEAALRLGDAEAERYAREWVLVAEPLLASARAQGVVRRFTDVEDVLRATGFLEPARSTA